MPILRQYRNGTTMFIPSGGDVFNPAKQAGDDPWADALDAEDTSSSLDQDAFGGPTKRDVVNGWTRKSVRNHTKWLYGVDAPALTGFGYALTLTVRDMPTQQEWVKLKRRWQARVERRDAFMRLHWVVEWQARGAPHMHCAVYFSSELEFQGQELLIDWVHAAKDWGAAAGAQDAKPINGEVGWLKYLSKHAARGAAHYQRQGSPEGWEKTGRLWGHRGEWPVVKAEDVQLADSVYFWMRRQIKAWRMADARAEPDPYLRKRRVKAARRMLKGYGKDESVQKAASTVRGISEWVPYEIQMMLIYYAAHLFGGGVITSVTSEAGETFLVDLASGQALSTSDQPS